MKAARVPPADVPPVPDAAARQASADGTIVVFTAGTERWRYEGDTLIYYIRYAADLKTQEAVYAAPRQR